MRKLILLILSVIIYVPLYAVDISVDVNTDRAAISPLIYGTNQLMEGDENVTLQRLGGNRTTGYNWENNYSNAGEDWYNTSDRWLCSSSYGYPDSVCNTSGGLYQQFRLDDIAAGRESLVTIQMAGYVAADQASTVTLAETAPSARWKQLDFTKGAAFVYPPDRSDDYVYMDEFVNFLVSTFGNASTPDGIKFYALDNEPALWDDTHPRIRPANPLCSEIVTLSTDLAKAIKDIDPYAEIFSPVLFGWTGYESLGATDWNTVKGSHQWFISWYLEQMAAAEVTDGRRLVDVLDIHYYSEARAGANFTYSTTCRVTEAGCTGADAQAARVHAPRSLWDPTYTENSWLGQWKSWGFPLIPEIETSINTYYPGTKLSFSEWAFGGGSDISGGIAYADTLGIFGKYGVYAATMWKTDYGLYQSAAFKMFRNYDGANSTYGDTKVYCESDNTADFPVYASEFSGDGTELHIVAINRSTSVETANISITPGSYSFDSADVWILDDSSPDITAASGVTGITGDSFSYDLPAYSVVHFVLHAIMGTATYTPTETDTVTPGGPTLTFTDTPTFTETPTFTPTETETFMACLMDDGEDGDGMNEFGGSWYCYAAGDDSSLTNPTGSFIMTVDSLGMNGMSANMSGIVGEVTANYSSLGMGTQLNDTAGSTADGGLGTETSLLDCGSGGIRFDARGDGKSYNIKIPYTTTDGTTLTGYNDYQYTFAAETAWTNIDVPFSSFTQATGWGVTFTVDEVLSHAKEFQITTAFYAAPGSVTTSADVWIDNLQIYGCSVCMSDYTPTVTPTLTQTATETDTGTVTETETETMTPGASTDTETATETETETITMTATDTFTETPTDTETAAVTETFTSTFTYTGTFTETQTPIDTYTMTPTQTMPADTTTPTPAAEEGSELVIDDLMAYPNPYNQNNKDRANLNFAYHITQSVENIELRIYTAAFRCVANVEKKDIRAGSGEIEVSKILLKYMANGTYYYVIKGVSDDGKVVYSKPGVLLLLK